MESPKKTNLQVIALLVLFVLGQYGCGGGGGGNGNGNGPDPCPGGIVVDQIGEREPNDTVANATSISSRMPDDGCTTLQIIGTLRSDGSFTGGPNADAFDFFSIILSEAEQYHIRLSELTNFDLDLHLFTEEGFSGTRIPGVNYFESPVDAPSEGNTEFITAELKSGVRYLIRVKAINTNDASFSYALFIDVEP